MTSVPLTNTRAKLPRSISIQYNTDLGAIDYVNATNTQIIDALSSKRLKLAAVERLEINQTVELKEWREFDSVGNSYQGGQVVEWCPGKEDISFTIEGILLYKEGDILDQFYPQDPSILPNGIESMLMMKDPFTIELLERRYATGSSTTIEYRSTYLLGCRLSSHPVSFNIGSADIIRQACTGKAARLIRTPWGASV
jgi:hypothetical protein